MRATTTPGLQHVDFFQILVVADKTCPCSEVHVEVVRQAADRRARVLVVAPALNSRLHHWVSDTDEAVSDAEERLELAVNELLGHGLDAAGVVGDADPLLAIEDSLATFDADVIVVSTHPPEQSNWLERRLIERAQERFGQPVVHVVSNYGLVAS